LSSVSSGKQKVGREKEVSGNSHRGGKMEERVKQRGRGTGLVDAALGAELRTKGFVFCG